MKGDSGINAFSKCRGGLKTRAYDGVADNSLVRCFYCSGIIVENLYLSTFPSDQHRELF